MARLEPVTKQQIVETLRLLADQILTGKVFVSDFEYRDRLNEPDQYSGDLTIGWKIVK